ncbi:DNA-binding response regulator [Trinickia fusca]|uniref:DNA-binding response regulator n=2 Tax=Trinickia fusca TaxID=2419777 RepID=A0A494XV41_9BURK|nr:DNA-binding response regulator [Trinickia fusca]
MRGALATYLQDAGFRVLEADCGAACRRQLQRYAIGLVFLNIGLPDCDSMQLARDILGNSSVALIFLTCRLDETDRIVALEMGGDDYLVKPFSLREALARVRTVLRRRAAGRAASHQTLLGFGEWTVDLVRRELMDRAMQAVPLTRGEFDLLAALVQARGRPLTRAYLSEVVSQSGEKESNERSVDVLVARLRRKMHGNEATRTRSTIVTMRGIGYKLGLNVQGQ